jgi:hypothetical protein
MISGDDVLGCMKHELAWALEGSAARWAEPYILWSAASDWSEFSHIRFGSRDSNCVCVEGEVFFEETLDQVEKEGWIPALNPRYVAFRLIDRDRGVRKSVILVREDQIPPGRDLGTLPLIVRCDLDVVHRLTRAAGIDFTGRRRAQRGRRRSRKRADSAPATVSERS